MTRHSAGPLPLATSDEAEKAANAAVVALSSRLAAASASAPSGR